MDGLVDDNGTGLIHLSSCYQPPTNPSLIPNALIYLLSTFFGILFELSDGQFPMISMFSVIFGAVSKKLILCCIKMYNCDTLF